MCGRRLPQLHQIVTQVGSIAFQCWSETVDMVNARCNGGGIQHALWHEHCFDGGMTDNTVVPTAKKRGQHCVNGFPI